MKPDSTEMLIGVSESDANEITRDEMYQYQFFSMRKTSSRLVPGCIAFPVRILEEVLAFASFLNFVLDRQWFIKGLIG